jgi:YD repeat-containing protein
MTVRNLISGPVVISSLLNNSVTHSTLKSYKNTYGRYVPDSILTLETDNPLPSITTFNGTAGSIDSHYGKAEARYESYGTNGNPLKVKTKDGIYTYFVWAYNGLYPVAKITSPLNTTIIVAIFDSNLSNGTTMSGIQADVAYLKNQLGTYINNESYMVSLYTYCPHVGKTSETTPNGVTTYYEYDGFGRLSAIRNDEGNLLKKYTYNYANE